MAQAVFISEDWLKDNTPLPSNMDIKQVYPFYKLAQDKWVRDILGDALYDELSDGIINNNLTTDEIALLKVIRPMLGFYIVYESIPFLYTKIKNIGVNSTVDDKQVNADAQRVKELRQECANNAEYYAKRLQKYLCNNKALFPNYNFQNDDVNPNTHQDYNCDLYIDPCFLDEKFIKQYYRQ